MRINNQRGLTMVEIMMVIVIISVLVALGVPMFLRYLKASKASEVDIVLKKLAEGGKSYFSSEQRYNPAGGGEPWHVAGTGSSAAGMPVPFDDYVFPGAGAVVINTAEPECSGGGPGIVGAPTGGKKQIPCRGVFPASGTPEKATMNKLLVTLTEPLYFKYYYESADAGIDASATVFAIADFAQGGPAHTASQFMFIDDTQEVFSSPTAITYEYE